MTGKHERVPLAKVVDLIRIDVPLPFRVLDDQERLLLNQGQAIGSQRMMDELVERGAWVDRHLVEAHRARSSALGSAALVARPQSLFDRWDRALRDLEAALRGTLKGQASEADWWARVDELADLVDRDADVALFLAVRRGDRRLAQYPQAHALHVAVFGLLAARQLGWDARRQRSLVGAALSMNVSILELQSQMAEHGTPPTPRQLEQIRAHPGKSAQMLQAAGVADQAWLRTVAEHHERADGTGYPAGSTGSCDEACVLRMADVYLAKITPRAQRVPLTPLLASRQLFQQANGSEKAMALIKAIGVHPPGCLVQLKSGEVAVVTRRGHAHPAPTVCTLSDRKGHPSVNSHTLDTADPACAIVGPCTDETPFARVLPERVYGLVAA